MGDVLKIVNDNHIGHFKCLPEAIGNATVEHDGLIVVRAKGMHSSTFNIVYGRPSVNEKNIDLIIRSIIDQDFGNDLPSFAWWWLKDIDCHKDFDSKLVDRLLAHGFFKQTSEMAMICDLSKSDLVRTHQFLKISKVKDERSLEDFIQIIEPYDRVARSFYENLPLHLLEALPERLFVGYPVDGQRPVTIGILYVNPDGSSAAIFSLLTEEAKRGKGYGSEMLWSLLVQAKSIGCQHVSLSASSADRYRIYERAGFHCVGEFECLEYA